MINIHLIKAKTNNVRVLVFVTNLIEAKAVLFSSISKTQASRGRNKSL
jgi:hypothetical protein